VGAPVVSRFTQLFAGDDVIEALYPAQQQLAREINPKVFSVREWKSKLREKNAFATDILVKPKIFLIGDKHELAELARHKP
jgi:hypothetical protein